MSIWLHIFRLAALTPPLLPGRNHPPAACVLPREITSEQ
jgi:hypothetical protein